MGMKRRRIGILRGKYVSGVPRKGDDDNPFKKRLKSFALSAGAALGAAAAPTELVTVLPATAAARSFGAVTAGHSETAPRWSEAATLFCDEKTVEHSSAP